MRFEVPYGNSTLSFTLPDTHAAEVIAPREVPPAPNGRAVVEAALANPVGSRTLAEVAGAKTVAIAINDKTRPVPHAELLPPLLEQLENLGIPPEHITLVIATGTHPVMPPSEYAMILPPEIMDRYPVICHDALDKDNLTYLGVTPRQTPVWINKTYLAAEVRLVVGNLEAHQFMGFSGGVKSAAIGLAGKTTIDHNHAMMRDAQARLGEYDHNPARQDVEDIGQMIGIDFALNAILNGQKKIVAVVFGEPRAVMERGIPQVRALYQVPIATPYDLMIVSPGGHPKDINLYQAQKGLAHAALITRQGGIIILAAACLEGTGSASYEHWMFERVMTTPAEVFERFQREGFRVGPHKAFQIARDAEWARVWLYSEMPPEFVQRLLLHPVVDLQTAVDTALAVLRPSARIGIMPAANATVPMLA